MLGLWFRVLGVGFTMNGFRVWGLRTIGFRIKVYRLGLEFTEIEVWGLGLRFGFWD